jgi:polar amino acid transport system permease protein
MGWSWDYVAQILPDLLRGMIYTIVVSLAAASIALTMGLALAVISRVAGGAGGALNRGFVELCRGMPILVLLYFGYFALPEVGISLSAATVGILVLGILYASYCSQAYRGALVSIPSGITDACSALGLPRHVVWLRVLIPLTLRKSAPALINYILIMYRETALLFAIGVPILLARAQIDAERSYRYLEAYTIVGLCYLAFNLPIVYLLNRYERRRQGTAA